MNLRLRQRMYAPLDKLYLALDKMMIMRTRNLRLMPDIGRRLAPGRPSYGEWCHIVGIFQTLIFSHLSRETGNHILDVGSGTGILAMACEPFLGDEGKYTGIDVNLNDVEFCRGHYPPDNFSFIHLNVKNSRYASAQEAGLKRWPVANESMDMVTALSVWTHLNEPDAVFYFSEIDRVLKPGGKSILTVYLLDELYYDGVEDRTAKPGRYNNTSGRSHIFDTPSSDSHNWFHPAWATHPEETIGLTTKGLETMLEGTSLSPTRTYLGNWKDIPGVFFQDVLVFEKR